MLCFKGEGWSGALWTNWTLTKGACDCLSTIFSYLRLLDTCVASLPIYPPVQINHPEAKCPFANTLYNPSPLLIFSSLPSVFDTIELVLNGGAHIPGVYDLFVWFEII